MKSDSAKSGRSAHPEMRQKMSRTLSKIAKKCRNGGDQLIRNLRAQRFNPIEQLRRAAIEGTGEAGDIQQSNISNATFNGTHIGAV